MVWTGNQLAVFTVRGSQNYMHLYDNSLKKITTISTPHCIEIVSASESGRVIGGMRNSLTVFDFDLDSVLRRPPHVNATSYSIEWDGVSIVVTTFAMRDILNVVCGVKDEILIENADHELVAFPEMAVVQREISAVWRLPRPKLLFVQTGNRIVLRDESSSREFDESVLCPSGSSFIQLNSSARFEEWPFDSCDWVFRVLKKELIENPAGCAGVLRSIQNLDDFRTIVNQIAVFAIQQGTGMQIIGVFNVLGTVDRANMVQCLEPHVRQRLAEFSPELSA
jgi:hypothetical protein